MSSLSQNEIDLIMGGGGGGAQGQTADALVPEIRVYDFRRPHRISREHLRSLEAMYERLAKSLEGWLIGRVRGQVTLSLQSVEQLSFGEYVLSLPSPCASFVLDVENSGGQQAVIDFGHEFAFYLVDRLFGGSGAGNYPDRALTQVECMAVRVVAERISGLLTEVWQDQIRLELRVAGFEAVPEILQAVNREDPVLVVTLQAKAGGITSLISVCLPFMQLEKFFSSKRQRRVNLTPGTERDREINRELAENSLRATRVPVSARFPEFSLPMRDLAALKVGSVLTTGIPTDSGVEIRVARQVRFRGLPARMGRTLAVRVLERVKTQPDRESDPDQPTPETEE